MDNLTEASMWSWINPLNGLPSVGTMYCSCVPAITSHSALANSDLRRVQITTTRVDGVKAPAQDGTLRHALREVDVDLVAVEVGVVRVAVRVMHP